MREYNLHIFVCLGKRCSSKGSEKILEMIKDRISSAGLKEEVRVSKSSCLKVCKETGEKGEFCPVIVVYPEGVWYRNITERDVGEIIDKHIDKGEVVERLLHFRLQS